MHASIRNAMLRDERVLDVRYLEKTSTCPLHAPRGTRMPMLLSFCGSMQSRNDPAEAEIRGFKAPNRGDMMNSFMNRMQNKVGKLQSFKSSSAISQCPIFVAELPNGGLLCLDFLGFVASMK